MARAGTNPYVICRMRSGWLVIGDVQPLPGYCLLLADPVVPSLNDLSPRSARRLSRRHGACRRRAAFLDRLRPGELRDLGQCGACPARAYHAALSDRAAGQAPPPGLHGLFVERGREIRRRRSRAGRQAERVYRGAAGRGLIDRPQSPGAHQPIETSVKSTRCSVVSLADPARHPPHARLRPDQSGAQDRRRTWAFGIRANPFLAP